MTKNQPQAIVIHHTAVSRDQNAKQFAAVKKYHIEKGWGDIGYHYLIEPDGKIVKGRAETEVGAHTKEQEMNSKSIGVCLTGFFDVEDPTTEQLAALEGLIQEVRTKYGIKPEQVYPHRFFANYKSCPGTRFNENLLELLATNKYSPKTEPRIPEWSEEAVAWVKQEHIMQEITGNPIPDYRLAVILKNFADTLKK